MWHIQSEYQLKNEYNTLRKYDGIPFIIGSPRRKHSLPPSKICADRPYFKRSSFLVDWLPGRSLKRSNSLNTLQITHTSRSTCLRIYREHFFEVACLACFEGYPGGNIP